MNATPSSHLHPSGSKPRISRNSLHEQVVSAIRDMIVQGSLKPGERLREREICEQLGISRTPLREALKVLAAENMVELLPNRGTRVVKITLDDLEEIFEVLGVLEALSGEHACVRLTNTEITEIRELHERMVRHYQNGERFEYFKLNQEIHERIMRGSRNRNLIALYGQVSGRVRHSRYVSNLSSRRWEQAIGEHEAMMRALEDRDGPRLFRILREHLRNKADAARTALLAESADDPDPGSSQAGASQ